ncbi:4'-phosphopantetheinyl transferase superfamily protein [Streptomyces sp. NPDC000987]|uniref:4'-phosphopantetheinyl transferase family protein n=1 Tax=Streptomyces sp. NPDC000987 TaxID=3154374 RepID=UPI00331672E7
MTSATRAREPAVPAAAAEAGARPDPATDAGPYDSTDAGRTPARTGDGRTAPDPGDPDPGAGTDRPVRLWLCADGDLPPQTAGALAERWLDRREKQTAREFVSERDRRRYLLAHTLVRRVLARETGLTEPELVIRRSPRGRPFLRCPAGGPPGGGDRLDFNLSHSGGYSLLGVARRRRIGVDLELLERLDRVGRPPDAITGTFAPEERAWIARARTDPLRGRRVLRLWTLKEAYAKARGLGLGLPFDSFAFTLAAGRGVLAFRLPEDDPTGRWSFLELEPVPGVLVAVAVQADEGPPPPLQLHRGFPRAGRGEPDTVTLPEPLGRPGA